MQLSSELLQFASHFNDRHFFILLQKPLLLLHHGLLIFCLFVFELVDESILVFVIVLLGKQILSGQAKDVNPRFKHHKHLHLQLLRLYLKSVFFVTDYLVPIRHVYLFLGISLIKGNVVDSSLQRL